MGFNSGFKGLRKIAALAPIKPSRQRERETDRQRERERGREGEREGEV